jgi:hypothetical protein
MEETRRSSATLRGRIAEAGLDVSFRFQTIQAGVDSADRDFAFGAELDLLPDRNSVRAIGKARPRQTKEITGALLIGDEVDGVLRLPNK